MVGDGRYSPSWGAVRQVGVCPYKKRPPGSRPPVWVHPRKASLQLLPTSRSADRRDIGSPNRNSVRGGLTTDKREEKTGGSSERENNSEDIRHGDRLATDRAGTKEIPPY